MPAVPAFDHIFLIVMGNHPAGQVIGSAGAPFISELAASYGLAANYTAVSHPGLPSYLALTGGSTFGLSTDCTGCFQNAPNIAVDRVAAPGRAWRAYMESMPSPAFAGDACPYMQKHDPFACYDNIRTGPAQFANAVPYAQLARDLPAPGSTPSYGWITPDMTHDMHDGTVAQGDTWLSSAVPAVLTCDAFTQRRSLPLITWDENDDSAGNEVAALVTARGVPAGFKSQAPCNHYSPLRTIETARGLAPLTASDAAATVMSGFLPGQ